MKSLRQIQDEAAAKVGSNKPAPPDTFGAVVEVVESSEVEGGLQLLAKVKSSSKVVGFDEEVVVRFRGDVAKSVTNFRKGGGRIDPKKPDASAGTVVTLESCYLTPDKDETGRPVISARWINTLQSSAKDGDSRSFVDEVLATAPRIGFANPRSGRPGEPDRITLGVNATSVRVELRNERGFYSKEMPREWALERLREVPSSEKVRVSVDALEPERAVLATSRESFEAEVREQLSAGSRAFCLARVFDGEEVIARSIYVSHKVVDGNYVPDVSRAIEELFANNVFRNVPNDTLFDGVESGEFKIEVVPGYRMTWAGDTSRDDNSAFKMVEDVKSGRSEHYEMIFGEDANNWARVIFAGIARDDSMAGFSPFNLIADGVKRFRANELATANFQPRVAPAVDSTHPPDVGGEFEAALSEGAPAPAPR